MQWGLRLSISKCLKWESVLFFGRGAYLSLSIRWKISSFQFETGPGGEDEECLDDGSGEEPEGESESERFKQMLESIVKVKVNIILESRGGI